MRAQNSLSQLFSSLLTLGRVCLHPPLVTPFRTSDFLLACLYMVLFAFGHFPSVLALTGVLALAFYLYILHPEDIKVTDSVTITTTIKHVVVVVVGLLALTVGHVFTLFVSLCIFLLIVAGSHSIIREHTV